MLFSICMLFPCDKNFAFCMVKSDTRCIILLTWRESRSRDADGAALTIVLGMPHVRDFITAPWTMVCSVHAAPLK